jgi:hypothetical protein
LEKYFLRWEVFDEVSQFLEELGLLIKEAAQLIIIGKDLHACNSKAVEHLYLLTFQLKVIGQRVILG